MIPGLWNVRYLLTKGPQTITIATSMPYQNVQVLKGLSETVQFSSITVAF